MLSSLDPAFLRARALDHGARATVAARMVRSSLGGVQAVKANGMVFVAEHDAAAARAAADAAQLQDAGTAPLMVLDLDLALAEAPCRGVERAVDPACMAEVQELVASAFGVEGSSTGLRADLADVPGADAWLLREDGRAIAALVATADPDLVAIWSMATAPARRREGHGAFLLRAVLGHYALEGATRACLIATPEGEPLYRAIGFRPIEQLQVWRPR